ncbi:MAG: hypothetical protein Q9217_005154 [Psora testacea]
MSGTNPFRRRDNTIQRYNASDGEAKDYFSKRFRAGIPIIDTNLQRPIKTKTGKTVRIISPHSAGSGFEYDSPNDALEASRMRPPSPSLNSTSSKSSEQEMAEDPFSAAPDEEDANTEVDGTRQNTPLTASSPSKLLEGSEVPTYPLKKPLATLNEGGISVEATAKSEGSRSTKPQYDVDDFKRLLLAGEMSLTAASTVAPPPVSFQTYASMGDNSSNTDASSISRQSLFESASGIHHESPRTSQEMTISDDERLRLVQYSASKNDKFKPSTPKHRHGKLVKANAPQLVSFEDPTLSLIDTETGTAPRSGGSRPTSLGASVDAQKPLPALPLLSSSKPTKNEAIPATSSDLESPEPHRSPASQRKNPPAPPPSRRHNQFRSKSSVSPSDRSSPISEKAFTAPVAGAQSPSFTSSKPVPPPPRRSGTIKHESTCSVPTISSIATSSDQSLTSTNALPPTPLTRSPSLVATKRRAQTSPLSGSPSMPPPPPPRRRGSSQSSFTQSKPSGDYRNIAEQRLRSDSGASSISQLQMTPVEENTEKKDVLAGLSALQKEVDELRRKFR